MLLLTVQTALSRREQKAKQSVMTQQLKGLKGAAA
jgi:hypothetical protein